MKVVLDTNVILSGIFWKGPPEKILRLWGKGHFELLISVPVFAEYQEIARRLLQKYERPAIDHILEDVFIRSQLISPISVNVPFCDDIDDIMFLELAIVGKANYLVSGDKHLHRIGKFPGGEIIKPSLFVNLF